MRPLFQITMMSMNEPECQFVAVLQTLTVVQGGSIHSGPGGEHTNEDCVTNRQTGDRVYTRVLIRPYTRNSRRQARSTLTRVRGGGRRVTGVVRGTQFD